MGAISALSRISLRPEFPYSGLVALAVESVLLCIRFLYKNLVSGRVLLFNAYALIKLDQIISLRNHLIS